MTIEEPVYTLSPSRISFLKEYGIVLCFAALYFFLNYFGLQVPYLAIYAIFGVIVFFIIYVESYKLTHIYKITPSQLMIEEGIIKRNRKAVFLNNIVDVNFKQGYIQRLIGYGTIIIGSSGGRSHEECELRLIGIKNPKYYVMEIERMIKEYQKSRKSENPNL